MSNEMLNKPEFSDMIEEESEKLEKNVDQMFLDMISLRSIFGGRCEF